MVGPQHHSYPHHAPLHAQQASGALAQLSLNGAGPHPRAGPGQLASGRTSSRDSSASSIGPNSSISNYNTGHHGHQSHRHATSGILSKVQQQHPSANAAPINHDANDSTGLIGSFIAAACSNNLNSNSNCINNTPAIASGRGGRQASLATLNPHHHNHHHHNHNHNHNQFLYHGHHLSNSSISNNASSRNSHFNLSSSASSSSSTSSSSSSSTSSTSSTALAPSFQTTANNGELVNPNNQQQQSNPLLTIQQQQQQQQNSPQNSSRYKTELCRPFEENGSCKYGEKCQFAHGLAELRTLTRHPKYKTEFCRTFHTTGFCPYGPRCHFIHNSKTPSSTVNKSVHQANSYNPLNGCNSTQDSPSSSPVSSAASSIVSNNSNIHHHHHANESSNNNHLSHRHSHHHSASLGSSGASSSHFSSSASTSSSLSVSASPTSSASSVSSSPSSTSPANQMEAVDSLAGEPYNPLGYLNDLQRHQLAASSLSPSPSAGEHHELAPLVHLSTGLQIESEDSTSGCGSSTSSGVGGNNESQRLFWLHQGTSSITSNNNNNNNSSSNNNNIGTNGGNNLDSDHQRHLNVEGSRWTTSMCASGLISSNRRIWQMQA